MPCKWCDGEVPPGRRDRQYCGNACKQRQYRQKQKLVLAQEHADIEACIELGRLRLQVAEQAQTIAEQVREISQLYLKLDVERRFLEDKQQRGFPAWLKKQDSPLKEKILGDTFFLPRDTRYHYEYRLRYILHCSEEELREFERLWKLMIF